MFEIFCINNTNFIFTVFNGIVLIFNTQIPYSLAAIACVLNSFFQSVIGAYNAKGINWGGILIPFILFLAFFLPKTDVNITTYEENSTTQIRVVKDVPLLIAIIGSFTSKIGKVLSDYTIAAYSLPNTEKYSYINAIESLANIRNNINDFITNQEVNNSSYTESWYNYIKECTIIGIELKQLNPNAIYKHLDFMQAIQFNSNIYGTEIYTTDSSANETNSYIGNNVTCTEAYKTLSSEKESLYYNFDNYLQLSENTSQNSDYLASISPSKELANLNNALSLIGQSQQTNYQILTNLYLMPIYKKALLSNKVNSQSISSSLVLQEELAQNNTKNALAMSALITYVPIVITFLEGIFYALTPIIVLIFMFGIGGMQICIRYSQILLFIATLKPTLTLINTFIVLSIKSEIYNHKLAISSIDGIIELEHIIENYLGISSTLFLILPSLLGFLIFSGGKAISNYGSGISNISSSASNKIIPSFTNSSPMFETTSAYTNSNINGLTMTDSSALAPSISVAHGFSNAIKTSENTLSSQQENFSKTISSMSNKQFSQIHSINSLNKIGENINNSTAESDQYIKSIAQQLSQGSNLNSVQSNTLLGAIGLNMQLAGNNILQGNLHNSLQNQDQTISNIMQAHQKQGTASQSATLTYQELLTKEFSKGESNSFSKILNKQEQQNLSQIAQDINMTSKSIEKLKTTQQQFGNNLNISSHTLSAQIANNQSSFNKILSWQQQNHSLSAKTMELLPNIKQIIPNSKQAYAEASIRALLELEPQKVNELISNSILQNK